MGRLLVSENRALLPKRVGNTPATAIGSFATVMDNHDPDIGVTVSGYHSGIPHYLTASFLRSTRDLIREYADFAVVESLPLPIIAANSGAAGIKLGGGASSIPEPGGGYLMRLPRGEPNRLLGRYNFWGSTGYQLRSVIFSRDIIFSIDETPYEDIVLLNAVLDAASAAAIVDMPFMNWFALLRRGPTLIPAGTLITFLTGMDRLELLPQIYGSLADLNNPIGPSTIALTGEQMSIMSMEILHRGVIGATPYMSWQEAIAKIYCFYVDTALSTFAQSEAFLPLNGPSSIRLSTYLSL